jgi:MarR family transcriptional regulator, organic hydroperoxide resistance regulator
MAPKSMFPFEQPEESTGFLLWQVSNMWHLAMKKVLDPLDLTFTQFALLAALQWLSSRQNDVTQQDIANHAKTDKMTTSKVLRTLQEKGFIQRAEARFDTRAKIVQITSAGTAILKQALPLVRQCDDDFFEVACTQNDAFPQHLLAMYLRG